MSKVMLLSNEEVYNWVTAIIETAYCEYEYVIMYIYILYI